MKFIKLKVIKYRGNIGEAAQLELYVNAHNITYMVITDEKASFQLVGDVNLYVVTDSDSINKLKALV